MSHTPGKLRVYFADSLRAWPGIDNGASKIVVHADVRGHRRSGVGGDTEEEVQANARRLVACWNACDGLSTDFLEISAQVVNEPIKELISDIEQERDELLAALIGMVEMYVPFINSGDAGNWDPETEPEVIAARAAIAKAEGKS